MDYRKACELLDLKGDFDESRLKKAYYKKALQFHPDKNKETEEKFKEIGAAYEFLQKHMKFKVEIGNFTYMELIKKVFNMDFETLMTYKNIEKIFEKSGEISLKMFEKMRKGLAIEIYQIIIRYNNILSVSDETLKKMKEILYKKMEKDNLVILNPTIDDLLDDKVYKLEMKNQTVFCPLWHDEICFDDSGNDLIVKCIPELDKNIKIDDLNNIICKTENKIQDVLNDGKLVFKIGNKDFTILSASLRITKCQTYILKNLGILRMNDKNIYDVTKRADIHVDIFLS